jgi:hypothetical protein
MNVKHTEKCRHLLPQGDRSRFRVLAQVMEKAPFFWALLSPLVYSLKHKHYVIGLNSGRDLYLYRLSLGLFGAGAATGVEAIPLNEMREVTYRQGLLTATLSFRKPDGKRVRLFVPLPAKGNATEIYEAMRYRI